METINQLTFKGISNASLGVSVLRYPLLTLPKERAEQVLVKGRAGALTRLEGEEVFETLVLSAEMMVENTQRLGEVAAWLRGSGQLTMGVNPTRFYKARVNEQVQFERMFKGAEHRQFHVQFMCEPYAYLTPEQSISLNTAGMLANPCKATARPKLTVTGSGNVTLVVGTTTVLINDLDGEIILDCEGMYAYSGDMLKNGMVELANDVWPELKPGNTGVSWSGNVTGVTVLPRWRDYV